MDKLTYLLFVAISLFFILDHRIDLGLGALYYFKLISGWRGLGIVQWGSSSFHYFPDLNRAEWSRI